MVALLSINETLSNIIELPRSKLRGIKPAVIELDMHGKDENTRGPRRLSFKVY